MATTSPSPSASPSVSPSPSPSAPSVTDTVSWWGEWVLSAAPWRILGIVVFSAVLQWVLTRVIRHVVDRAAAKERSNRPDEAAASDGVSLGLLKERRQQRANAIGQLVRSVLAVFIWGSALLMILPLFGLDITPLLASASVVGVALGFGAQTLIKDYLSGIFLILEDQFGVGDFVDLGEAIGTVEEVTLRVTRLRDTSGIVWYVRNGEILRVANRSQGWTMAIIDIPIAYDQDLESVQEVVERAAEDMVTDPDCLITEFNRPTFGGVESVSGEAVTIRVTAKADPDDQIAVAREVRRQLKQAFDAAGIQVPVVFRMPGGPGATPGTAGRPR